MATEVSIRTWRSLAETDPDAIAKIWIDPVDGLTEAVRVSRRLVLVKCMTYVSSGKLWLGEFLTLKHALDLGCRLEDRFIHVGGVGPDPKDRRQVHARNNASVLYVLRVPRKKAS